SNYTGLPDKFDEPFDEIYRRVTHRIRAHNAFQQPANFFPASWLNSVVIDFKTEFDAWKIRGDYTDYFQMCRQRNLRFKFLHLVVCAYLHISYDLPRIISKHWPGNSVGQRQQDEECIEKIFLSLEPIFGEVFNEVAGESKVIGNLWFLKSLLRE